MANVTHRLRPPLRFAPAHPILADEPLEIGPLNPRAPGRLRNILRIAGQKIAQILPLKGLNDGNLHILEGPICRHASAQWPCRLGRFRRLRALQKKE